MEKIINFIPNWNGHLYLQNQKDTSIKEIYENLDYINKNFIEIEVNNIQKTNQIIQTEFKKNITKFQLSVTGDHSNSYPLIKTFSENFKKDFNLVIFDAHPDVEIGTDLISHEDYLRFLVEEKSVKPENIYLIGIRTFSRTELEYLIENKINYYSISDTIQNPNKITSILKELKNIYLSVDIDVLDPDHAPGTYYTEYCGLYIQELLNYIKLIKPNLLSADITEYYKEKDNTEEITKQNTIKIIGEIIN